MHTRSQHPVAQDENEGPSRMNALPHIQRNVPMRQPVTMEEERKESEILGISQAATIHAGQQQPYVGHARSMPSGVPSQGLGAPRSGVLPH